MQIRGDSTNLKQKSTIEVRYHYMRFEDEATYPAEKFPSSAW
jgi:hypothetical protein